MSAATTQTETPDGGLEFWFEFASTYSYLSALRISEAAETADVSVTWRPFLLGPIFAAQGWHTSPFNIYPAKGRYMWRDMTRLAEARGLAFVKPVVFPQNGLLAARIAIAALAHEGTAGSAFCIEVFRAQFERGQDISELDTLARSLDRAGLPEHLLSQGQTPETKAALREQTARAESLGLFGAPSFTLDDEVFWGDDRLDQALSFAASARQGEADPATRHAEPCQ